MRDDCTCFLIGFHSIVLGINLYNLEAKVLLLLRPGVFLSFFSRGGSEPSSNILTVWSQARQRLPNCSMAVMIWASDTGVMGFSPVFTSPQGRSELVTHRPGLAELYGPAPTPWPTPPPPHCWQKISSRRDPGMHHQHRTHWLSTLHLLHPLLKNVSMWGHDIPSKCNFSYMSVSIYSISNVEINLAILFLL